MQTDDPSQSELRELSPEDDATALWSSSVCDAPGPYERVAAAVKVAALAIGPAAALGVVFAFCPDVTYGWLFLIQIALIYATAIGGTSVVMRWLALGTNPFVDRAMTAPIFAALLAATVGVAARTFDPDVDAFVGALLTIPFIGTLGLYWSIASIFLARDGAEKRTRRRWRIRDLSISLLLLGLYAAALRWQIGWAELDEEEAVQTILLWTASVAGFGLVPVGIDLVCRSVTRSKWRWFYAAMWMPVLLCGLGWSLAEMAVGRDTDTTLYVFVSSCYLVLSATVATLIAWRPLLATVRRLDRQIELRRASEPAERAQSVPLGSSSTEERS